MKDKSGTRKWEAGIGALQSLAISLLSMACISAPAFGQQPQPQPLYSVNSKAVQGVGPGNWAYGAEVNLYANPSIGSDTSGNGTSGNPYRTIGRALQDIPAFVSQHYIINLAAGTYREEVVIANRYFAPNARTNLRSATVELKGDPAAPDNYIISGADDGAPTTPVRDYAILCSFSSCTLNGVSLQYAAKIGFWQQGGRSIIHQSTFRHITNSGAIAVEMDAAAYSEPRGNITISDVYAGLRLASNSTFYGWWALPTGFPSSVNLTITGVTGGVGIDVLDRAYYLLVGTTSVSGTDVSGSIGVRSWTWGTYEPDFQLVSHFDIAFKGWAQGEFDSYETTISYCNTGIQLSDQSRYVFISGAEPTFTNVAAPYDLAQNSWVTTATQTLFGGVMKSAGPVSIAAGGTNQNVTLTPSGAGYTVLNGNVGIGTVSISSGQKLEINGGVALNTTTSQPACSATTRGTFWVTQGGGGVKDNVEVCAKDASNNYAWRTIY